MTAREAPSSRLHIHASHCTTRHRTAAAQARQAELNDAHRYDHPVIDIELVRA